MTAIDAIAIDDSLQRASTWLRSMQSSRGAWNDFWTPSGASDEWVTAYVGAALASASDQASQASSRAAWRYLAEKQRADGGWGYCTEVPSDADSTVWALVLAERNGKGHSRCARDAYRFLEQAGVTGGIATYAEVPSIRTYVQAAGSRSFSGWTAAHACVTGAAGQLPPLQARLLDEMLAAQRSDGSWRSYWWFDDAYATAMSVVALAGQVGSRTAAAVARACEWACRRLAGGDEPSSFSLSLLLMILQHGDVAPAEMVRCAAALAAEQEASGRWRGSARLRIPCPDVADPGAIRSWRRWWGSGSPFNIYSVDLRSTFTTATAYFALTLLSRHARSNAVAR